MADKIYTRDYDRFVRKVKQFCIRNSLLASGDKILVAVSGGPDSTTLLHVLRAFESEMGISIAAAHLEHGLRGKESIADQEFVKNMAARLGVSLFLKSASIRDAKKRGESLEEAARRLRFEFFAELLKKEGFSSIATGHTKDDHVETIVFRLLQGTGPSGFAGIQPRSGCVIHPLLCATKEEVLDYIKRNNLSFRFDHTNLDRTIVRNKVRHDVIPLLKTINKRYDEHIVKLSRITQEDNDFLEMAAEKELAGILHDNESGRIAIDYDAFHAMANSIKRRIVLKLIRRLMEGETEDLRKPSIPFIGVDAIINRCPRPNGVLYRTSGYTVRREYNALVFQKRVVGTGKRGYLYVIENADSYVYIPEAGININLKIEKGTLRFQKHKLYFDLDKLVFPLLIRNRKAGDKIRLKNLGTRKVKNIFIDDKVPMELRELTPVVISGGGVAGIFCSLYGRENRVSANCMVSGKTSRILSCELSKRTV